MNKHIQFFVFVVCIISFYVVNESDCKNIKAGLLTNSFSLIEQVQGINSHNYTLNNSFAEMDKCNITNCPSVNGYCDGDKMCVCNSRFANFPVNKDLPACNYERKKIIIAFTLELLLPFGSSYFYLGQNANGILKFSVLVLLPIILLYILCHYFPCYKQGGDLVFNFITIAYLIGFLLWIIIDLINYTLNKNRDSNGIELVHWFKFEIKKK